jgi:hypothetical protein
MGEYAGEWFIVKEALRSIISSRGIYVYRRKVDERLEYCFWRRGVRIDDGEIATGWVREGEIVQIGGAYRAI